MEQRRKEMHLTQDHLAEKLGVTLASYGHWAHGRREPDLATLERIAAELKCSAAWLLYGVEVPSDERATHLLRVMEALPEYKRDVLVQVADSLAEKKAANER